MSLKIHWNRKHLIGAVGVLLLSGGYALRAQQTGAPLTLAHALDAARRASPEIRAAREAYDAARARTRQAAAYPNPTFTYGREQTSGQGATASQNTAAIEQRIELGGTRSARLSTARLREEAAAARVAAATHQVEYETIRAYALAAAADQRAKLAEQAAAAFIQALQVSERRLAAGDVSGYAHRRIRLEAARYATLRAEAALARSTARLGLSALLSTTPDSIPGAQLEPGDSLPLAPLPIARATDLAPNAETDAELDSLVRLALRSRGDLRAVEREGSAARAETRLAARERVPAPALLLGYKNERTPGAPGQASGYIAGMSLALPLWDRRANAVAAADAESRRRASEVEAMQRRVVREVAEAYAAYRTLSTQLEVTRLQVGAETATALRAVQVAYSEGEVTVVEWLDAVRAYHEMETSYVTLRAEALIRRAALERAVGSPLTRGADAPAKE